MPVIKSAIKKLRQDRKREKTNDEIRSTVKQSVRLARKNKSGASVAEAMSTVDKAVKKNILHKNKAARIKSSLSKLAKPAPAKKTTTQKPVANSTSSKKSSTKTAKKK